MPDVHDSDEEVRTGWITKALYIGLIGANLYLLADWWAGTPQGEAAVERWKGRLEAARRKAAECEGCNRRKAKIRNLVDHMHREAERAVAGEEIDTVPEDAPQ